MSYLLSRTLETGLSWQGRTQERKDTATAGLVSGLEMKWLPCSISRKGKEEGVLGVPLGGAAVFGNSPNRRCCLLRFPKI